jgi:hypothetical protein
VTEDDQLDQLSTAELHDLAIRRARRHLDIRFFWRLIEVLPVAEAGAGELREAEADVAAESDVATIAAHLNDVTDAGRGDVAELLRPFYLDYLKQHSVKPE